MPHSLRVVTNKVHQNVQTWG